MNVKIEKTEAILLILIVMINKILLNINTYEQSSFTR